MSRRAGLTIPEVMVAMTLTGILLTLVYPLLTQTVKAMLRADADTQSQQKAVLLIEKFFSDFASTTRASLTVLESLPAASFLSEREMSVPGLAFLKANDDYYPSDGNSEPIVWKKFVAMRFNAAEKCLQRMEFPYPGSSQPACMRPEQLANVMNDFRYRGSERLVVGGIEELKMHATGDCSLTLELVAQQRADVNKRTKIQVVLSMRN